MMMTIILLLSLWFPAEIFLHISEPAREFAFAFKEIKKTSKTMTTLLFVKHFPLTFKISKVLEEFVLIN